MVMMSMGGLVRATGVMFPMDLLYHLCTVVLWCNFHSSSKAFIIAKFLRDCNPSLIFGGLFAIFWNLCPVHTSHWLNISPSIIEHNMVKFSFFAHSSSLLFFSLTLGLFLDLSDFWDDFMTFPWYAWSYRDFCTNLGHLGDSAVPSIDMHMHGGMWHYTHQFHRHNLAENPMWRISKCNWPHCRWLKVPGMWSWVCWYSRGGQLMGKMTSHFVGMVYDLQGATNHSWRGESHHLMGN